jgi:hypothetical protein
LNNSDIPSTHDEIRRAQLVAAAETLVAWVHQRRATWPERPLVTLDSSLSIPLHDIDLSPPRVDPEDAADSTLSPMLEAVANLQAPVPPKSRRLLLDGALAVSRTVAAILGGAAGLAGQLGAAAGRAGSATAGLAGPAIRFGMVAAAISLVAAVGWFARPYVLKAITTPKTGTAVFESIPPSEILVDGTSIGTAPLTADLATGRHVIQFRRRRAVRTVEIDVAGGRSTTARVDWEAPETGRLIARSEPAGARVLVDGTDRGVTPLTLEDVPVGQHTVVLQSDQGSVRRTVTVSVDRVAAVNESIFAGFVRVFAPFELQITEGARSLRLDEQNQLMLAAGVHDLRFENSAFGYSDVKRVEIQPGQTASLSLVPMPSTLTVIASVPATVIVDGEPIGETPLTNHPIALGTRDIIVRNAAGDERRFTRTVTVAPVSIDVSF